MNVAPKSQPSAAICSEGCADASHCTGACQPPLLKSTGKRCRWCDEGCRRIGTEHWIVKSFSPARIDIRPCVAVVSK